MEIFLPGYIVEFVRFRGFGNSDSQPTEIDRDSIVVDISADPVIYTAQKMNTEIIAALGHNYNALIE